MVNRLSQTIGVIALVTTTKESLGSGPLTAPSMVRVLYAWEDGLSHRCNYIAYFYGAFESLWSCFHPGFQLLEVNAISDPRAIGLNHSPQIAAIRSSSF